MDTGGGRVEEGFEDFNQFKAAYIVLIQSDNDQGTVIDPIIFFFFLRLFNTQ